MIPDTHRKIVLARITTLAADKVSRQRLGIGRTLLPQHAQKPAVLGMSPPQLQHLVKNLLRLIESVPHRAVPTPLPCG
jgi:hypothetical protein